MWENMVFCQCFPTLQVIIPSFENVLKKIYQMLQSVELTLREFFVLLGIEIFQDNAIFYQKRVY